MTLRWTTIDLPWAGGVDDKRHPYLRELPKAETLINLRFQQSGAWVARDGYTNLNGPAQEPDVGFVWGGVLTQTAGSTWLLDQPGGNWRQLGFTGPRNVGVAQRPILRTQEGASSVASGVQNGHALHAWTRSPGGDVYVMVRNLETGVVVYGPTTITGLDTTAPYASSLRACAHENSYVTVFARGLGSGSSASAVTFLITEAGAVTVGAASILTGAGFVSSDNYEVHANPDNSNVYVVTDNGADLRLVRLVRSGLALVAESATTLLAAGTLAAPRGVVHNADAGLVFAFSTSTGGGGGDIQAWRATAGATLPASVALLWSETPSAIDTNAQSFFRAAPRASGTTCLLIEGTTDESPYDLAAVPPGNIGPTAQPTGVWRIELDDGGTQTSMETTWNVYLAAAPVEWNGAVHAWLLGPDDEQSETTQNLLSWPYGGGPTVAFMWSRAWASRRVGYVATCEADVEGLRRVAEYGHDVVSFATPSFPVGRSATASVPQSYVSGTDAIISSATVELPSTEVAPVGVFSNPALRSLREYRFGARHVATAEASELGLVASGYLACLDGDRVGDMMQMAPPVPVDVWQEGISPSPVSGSRAAVVFCWEWRDALGRLHRSAPSDPIYAGLTSTSGYAYSAIKTRIAIPPFIDWEIKSGCLPKDIYLVAYSSPQVRTGATLFSFDDLYYAETPAYGRSLESIRDAAYPWMTEQIVIGAYTTGTGNERPLYTNGTPPVLANDPAINPLHMTTTRNRVWLIDSENRDTVWYSKPLSNGLPPEFSSLLTLAVPTEAGELVALGAVDDLVLLMSESSIFGLDTAENGPDSTGTGDFPPLRRISREVGCVNAASVITTDVGCFFASAAGIYLVQGTGQLVWVGRDLGDDVDVSAIVSAHVVPERKEVVFATSSTLLVYDYDHGQWTRMVWTGTDGPTEGAEVVSTVVYGGETVTVSTDGRAWQEDTSTPLFGAEAVTYQARTGWIHLAGLQGFQRVRRFGLLGRIAFDPTPTPPFEGPVAFGTLAIRCIYDYDETQFEDYSIDLATVSGRLDPLRLRFHMSRQKCQAVAFRFTYAPPTGSQDVQRFYGRPELVGLALEVGTKGRLYPRAHALGYTPSEG